MDSTSPQPLPPAMEDDDESSAVNKAKPQKLEIKAKEKKSQLARDLFNEVVRDVLFDIGPNEEDLRKSWKRNFLVLYFIFQRN